MRIIRATNYDDMSRKAAGLFIAQVLLNPRSVLGLATGSTPLGLYEQLVTAHTQDGLDFSAVRTVNLDEYAGLDPLHEQSYRYFMNQNLFSKLNILADNTHVPNGLAADADVECRLYDALIHTLGGIDMQLLGIGHNGHIGFNEPDDVFAKGTHRVSLAQSTIDANKRFFESEADVPRFAFTMGLLPIMQARHVVLVASGSGKADILHRALNGPVTPRVPASLLQLHPNVTVVADAAALFPN